jgi:hypothetical protein
VTESAPHEGPPRGTLELRVDADQRPGWVSGNDRLPEPGERVYTVEGPATVVKILGRTGSGRLIELQIDGRAEAFFAAAGNIRVQPDPPSAPPAAPPPAE